METIFVIAVVSALAIGRDAGVQPVNQCGLRLLLVVTSGLITCLSAKMVAAACGDQTPGCPPVSQQSTHRWERLHLAVWLAVATFLIFVVDWVTMVRTNWGWGRFIIIDELLILAPLIFPWLVSWAYLFEIGEVGTTQRTAANPTRWQFVMQQSRIVLGLGLLPVLAVCLLTDIVRSTQPTLLVGPWSPLIFLSPLALVLVSYPYVLMLLWNMSPMPDSSRRRRLVEFAQRHQIRIRDVLIWNTNGQIVNAATTGALPGFRYVFLSDRLLEITDTPQAEAVFAHELAHARFHHVLRRSLALVLPLSTIVAGSRLLQLCGVVAGQTADAATGTAATTAQLVSFGCVAGTLLFMVVGLGWYSRMLEHQADLWACQQLPAASPQESLGRYLAVLCRMHDGLPNQGRGWLHPSWEARRDFLIRAVDDTEYARSFTRRLSVLAHVAQWTALAAILLMAVV